MNKFVNAVKALDLGVVRELTIKEPKWLEWEEKDGKNAVHFLCGVPMVWIGRNGKPIPDRKAAEAESLKILRFLLRSGVDINSVHRIPDKNCGYFPATAVWWAYTRGRNVTLYKYLLKQGADPRGCMYAITWYDDTKAADFFKKHGAFLQRDDRGKVLAAYFEDIDDPGGPDSPLLAAFAWKKWKMAEWLLAHGAHPDTTDQGGCTALFHAVRKKYEPQRIKLLLKYGADPDLACFAGKTPRQLAEKYRDKTIRELFH